MYFNKSPRVSGKSRALGLKSLVFAGMSSVFFASPSFALIQAELGLGLRNSVKDDEPYDEKFSGNEVQIAAHIDPIPLVPVSFGLSLNTFMSEHTVSKANWKNNGSSLGLEVMAWSPIAFLSFRPYAKFAYDIWGVAAYITKQELLGVSTETTADATLVRGNKISGGVRWELLPLVYFHVEAALASRGYKFKTDETNRYDEQSTTIFLGASANL